MNDGLKDSYRKAIIGVLSANPRVERVVLFGSRATGTFTSTSDIDLALFGGELTLNDQSDLSAKIEELSIPQQVDLVLYNQIRNKKLIGHIQQHGVEWFLKRVNNMIIGDRMSTWRILTLGEIASPNDHGFVDGPFGSNLPSSCYVDSGIPVIRGSNLSLGLKKFIDKEFVYVSIETAERLRRSICYPEDIIFTKKGTIGQTGIVPSHPIYKIFLLSSNQMKLSVNKNIANPLFVYYFVSSPNSRNKIIRDSEATGVPKINLTYLRDFPISLPSLVEQRAIAHILGTLDDKIELNRRMNETLEAMARAIFKSWFVDFDPVRAKAEGRDPGLPNHIADLFPDEFEDSELGEIPKGWKVCSLSEILEINPPRQIRKGNVAPYLDMAGMPTQGHSPVSWIDREFSSGMKFKNGDTLVARITPCLENGKTAYVDFLKDEEIGWGSTEYIVLRPREPIPLVYAYLLARSNEFRTFAIQRMTGSSGRQRVPAESLIHYSIVSPSFDSVIFKKFGQLVCPLFHRIKAAMQHSRTLTALRDVLLPKLISGEIRVVDLFMKN